jgi:hypothetical protein
MTLIVEAKNKAELKTKLEAGCAILNPTPWGTEFKLSQDVPIGFREPVVLDPATRRRVAQIEKTATGWKVK